MKDFDGIEPSPFVEEADGHRKSSLRFCTGRYSVSKNGNQSFSVKGFFPIGQSILHSSPNAIYRVIARTNIYDGNFPFKNDLESSKNDSILTGKQLVLPNHHVYNRPMSVITLISLLFCLSVRCTQAMINR